MLSSVDPCEDFYEHVCGGWIYDRRVPVDKVLLDVRTETQRAIDDKIIGEPY
ncbi:hypothetical protein IscW_ISCW019178 [Ixodes scapularis]|uniref:Peptidase M13 N-terminal domain-containing protein n=1 Tax=Ixodes scapularis TaxID=6945 RepID=B7PR41_IXOSC|nr:hypothetical protein IscW_ISCW019178 [Ixodes scapularis]|eukprot:XP_002436233.1 hypothetical protein IscW_ISCW019178 [Ixodes scapularis]